MDKIILKFGQGVDAKFIIIDPDTNVDVRDFTGQTYEQVRETLEADNIPCELWDRPITLPPFLL